MDVLVGRPVRLPRALFAEDIRRGCTKEPPDGTHLDGRVTAFSGVGSRPFSIVLTVLDPDDDDDPLMQEELEEGATLRQVREWIADLGDHEDRAQLGSTMSVRSTPRQAAHSAGHGVLPINDPPHKFDYQHCALECTKR